MIGFNDVVKNRPHSVSIKCISGHGVVYEILKEEFIHRMQRDPKTWKLIL
jgi:hypothetical protein